MVNYGILGNIMDVRDTLEKKITNYCRNGKTNYKVIQSYKSLIYSLTDVENTLKHVKYLPQFLMMESVFRERMENDPNLSGMIMYVNAREWISYDLDIVHFDFTKTNFLKP